MIAQLRDPKKVLRSAGFKCTQTRERVLQELAKAEKPLAIDELTKRLGGSVHMVTLYRILRDFVDAGLVYQTDFRTGKAYFEYQETHHHHVVCTSCGYREHVNACVSYDNIQTAKFDAIRHHALEFFGVCQSCKESLQSK